MADPEFAVEVSAARRERVEALTGRLLRLTDSAAAVLEAALEAEQPQVRLQAARMVLEQGRRLYREEVRDRELHDRMSALEGALADATAATAPSPYGMDGTQ